MNLKLTVTLNRLHRQPEEDHGHGRPPGPSAVPLVSDNRTIETTAQAKAASATLRAIADMIDGEFKHQQTEKNNDE